MEDTRCGWKWMRSMEYWAKPRARRTPHTRTLTVTRERVMQGQGKKVPDARRGRKWTQAIEKWAKPRTWHTPCTRTLRRTREWAIRGHWKELPTAIVDRSGHAPYKTGQNDVRGTRHVHGPLHGPVNGLYGVTGKNGRCPSWTEVDARHGILGETTYEAHPTYTDPYKNP